MNAEQMTPTEIQALKNDMLAEVINLHAYIRELKAKARKLEEDFSYHQKLYDPSHWPSQADV